MAKAAGNGYPLRLPPPRQSSTLPPPPANNPSETEREKCWDWYTGDLHSRLHPDAKMIVISTRWHQDDLVGRLLKAQEEDEDADQWTVLHRPAQGDDGETLWPAWADGRRRYDKRWARKKAAVVGPRKWQAQYQGRPAPQTGLFFEFKWIMRDRRPERADLRCYGLSDLARSRSKGDWTVHAVLGIDRDLRPWVLDLWRERTTPDEWIAPMVDMVEKWRPAIWLQEAGPIWAMTEPFLTNELHRRKVYVPIEALPSVEDKETRAAGIQGYVAAHGLWIDRGAPFASALIGELLGFPTATHDDQVDALSLAGRLGRRLVGPSTREAAKPPPGHVSFEQLRKGTGYGSRRPVQ